MKKPAKYPIVAVFYDPKGNPVQRYGFRPEDVPEAVYLLRIAYASIANVYGPPTYSIVAKGPWNKDVERALNFRNLNA